MKNKPQTASSPPPPIPKSGNRIKVSTAPTTPARHGIPVFIHPPDDIEQPTTESEIL